MFGMPTTDGLFAGWRYLPEDAPAARFAHVTAANAGVRIEFDLIDNQKLISIIQIADKPAQILITAFDRHANVCSGKQTLSFVEFVAARVGDFERRVFGSGGVAQIVLANNLV